MATINYSVGMKPNKGKDKDQYPKKAYASIQLSEIMDLHDFADHIASHGSVYSRGDIYNILSQTVDCMREMILSGKKVYLGDLGSFYPAVSSTGAISSSEFTAANIKKLTVNWTRSSRLKNMVGEAQFNLVASRAAQAAVVAAEKAGATEVTLK